MGFGPTTSTLARLRSTPELYPHQRDGSLLAHQKLKCKNFFKNSCIFFDYPITSRLPTWSGAETIPSSSIRSIKEAALL